MSVFNILLVGTGGFIGSVARYITVITIDKRLNSVFPYGTLAVNIVGSLVLGIILASVMKKTGDVTHSWRLFMGTGFCGGFTTFSAFASENLYLFESKFTAQGLFYIAISVTAGILAVWVGIFIGRTVI